MSGHHPLIGPSGWKTWGTCTAQPLRHNDRLLGAANDTESGNQFTAEGNAAHNLLELHINAGHEVASSWVGTTYYDGPSGLEIEYDDDMLFNVGDCIDYINSLGNGVLMAEQGVHWTVENLEAEGWPKHGGTMDALLIPNGDPSHLHLFDLKYGRGVKVEAEGNGQLRLYGLMTLESLDFMLDEIELVSLHIMQPRLNHFVEEMLTREELVAWGEDIVKPTIDKVLYNGEFVPSADGCRFCPLKGGCRDYQEFARIAYTAYRENPRLDGLVEFLKHVDVMEDAIKAAREEAFRLIKAGGTVEGWKIVEGRSNRQWQKVGDDLGLAQQLTRVGVADPWQPKKLISPAQAEKQIPKARWPELPAIHKPEGKPTLAPESDPRVALQFDVADAFPILESEE